jgi:hypothetical protein
LDFIGGSRAIKHDGAGKPIAWVKERENFFQPRRHDKTKPQPVFCRQAGRSSRNALEKSGRANALSAGLGEFAGRRPGK